MSNCSMEKKPYELPQPQYALWYDIGHRIGFCEQAIVGSLLCQGKISVPKNLLPSDTRELIKSMANDRGVLLKFA